MPLGSGARFSSRLLLRLSLARHADSPHNDAEIEIDPLGLVPSELDPAPPHGSRPQPPPPQMILEPFFRDVGRIAQIFWRVLLWTPRPPYDFAELVRQMVRVGVQSMPVVLLTAVFTGMVMALQIFTVLARFGAENYVGSIVGLAMVRELAAVLGALMIAGRCGSSMGAELGTMRVTEQIDALEVLATDPVHYLIVPRVWATTLMLPLLIVLADAIGIFGGYFVSVIVMGANPTTYLDNTFRYMELSDLLSGLVKAAVFGLLIATIGCAKGYYTRGGAEGVGRATTAAVVTASIAVLIANFFLTKLMF